MKLSVRALALLVSVFGIARFVEPAMAQTERKPPATYPALPSEIPAKFTPTNAGFDHSKRDVMIPMRDGVKLHTVLLIPKGAMRAPMLLTRTPYDANKLTSHAESAHLGPVLNGYDNALDVILEGGYLRVVQDIRGKHGSEGDYVVNRPLRGPQNPTPVDHATDTWDTIDWLVKHIPESNGKVGILGISYDGFLPLMALVDPHPALKVSVPMNPMVDGWMGDDWFHYGAFRQINVSWIYNQVATRKGEAKWWRSHHDEYDMYMQAGSAGELGRRRGLDQLGFWKKLVEHPAYDAFWRDQAVDKLLAARPLKTPVMLVHSLWDQEDIYGAPAVYKAIQPQDTGKDKVFLVIGPWHHGQMIGNGSALGAVKFGSDTALYFRKKILRPFLDQYLQDGAPKADIAPVTAFETGTNAWRRYSAWPPKAEGDKAVRATPLYLRAGLKLSLAAPASGEAAFEEYVSDPAKPVPFRARPIWPMGYDQGNTWSRWLVDDQREASGRPDVVAFLSDTLSAPRKIRGEPIANLVASTSGSDADWVVKLIDVYPDEVGGDEVMGGYQLMIAADIFRGRYREGFDTARPIAPDTPLLYRFALPTTNHVFLPGHRIMVQVQSSWFPLYDRNPQTFVPNIFWAKPGDYRKATQRIYHAPDQSSFVELPLVAPLANALPEAGRAEASRVTIVKTPDDGIQPQAVVDVQGVLHLIYFKGDPSAGDLFYVRRAPGQHRFSDPVRVNSQPGSAIAVGTIRGGQLAAGKGGRVHVAWNGSGKALPRNQAGREPMLYSRLNDAGTAFEPQRNLMQLSDGLDGGGTIAADAAGNVYVAWHALKIKSPAGEDNRQVWLARSADDGKTFGPETTANPKPSGACGCCGMRAYADSKGTAYLLYRAATEGVHRDMVLLTSTDRGKRFATVTLHRWTTGNCPMSSEAFAEGPDSAYGAWETEGQVYFTRMAPGSSKPRNPVAAPGEGRSRKHPALAANRRGEMILVWTEGTGWERGGALAWQVFDKSGQPTAARGRTTNAIPVWGLATVVADKDGAFTILH